MTDRRLSRVTKSATGALLASLPPWAWTVAERLRDRPPATIPKADRPEAIFMHIHKCAGTSVLAALNGCPEVWACAARPGTFEGRVGREQIEDDLWENAVKFTIVRNPFDRVVSCYLMMRRSPRWRSLFADFDAFVDFLRWSDLESHRIDRERYGPGGFAGHIDFVLHHCSAMVNPKYHLDEMDLIGRLEDLPSFWGSLQERLSCGLPELGHLRSASEPDYQACYTERTRSIVERVYAGDLERLGYSFPG